MKAIDGAKVTASHNQAAGHRRKMRRIQKFAVIFQNSAFVALDDSAGNKLRAMTKPEIAKKRSTPEKNRTYRSSASRKKG